MKVSARTTFTASLIGTVISTVMWLLGIGDQIWPSNPQLAVFLLVILVTVVMTRILTLDEADEKESV